MPQIPKIAWLALVALSALLTVVSELVRDHIQAQPWRILVHAVMGAAIGLALWAITRAALRRRR